MDSTQNIISFCTGYGGLDLGLKRVWPDSRTVAYVEIEAFAIANLVAKMEQGKLDSAPVWTNLKAFDGLPFRGKVHGITAGYPCQPFSVAGKRQGTEDPRHLFPYLLKHIEAIRPLWCFFENVGGHLQLGFAEVYRSLRGLGYSVEAGLFTAAEVGAPHKRERLFILAYTSSDGALRRPNTIQCEDGRQRRSLLQEPVGTNTELDNAIKCRSGTGSERTRGQKGANSDRSSKRSIMANPNNQQGRTYTKGRDNDTEARSAGEKLADTPSNGIQSSPEHSPRHRQELFENGSIISRWPARPGQEQYDWEEPRTVKSGMGRAVDGTASRVDELRLLGNGVVPQTAELAFRTLWSKTK